jgi:hypothetical protein
MPALDLRAVFKAALAAQLGLSEAALEADVFPDSRAVKPLEGLFYLARRRHGGDCAAVTFRASAARGQGKLGQIDVCIGDIRSLSY